MLSSHGQRASSPRHSGGWAGKGRRAGNYVSGIWILPPIPLSTELSDFRQSVQRGSECGCKQTLKNMWKHAPRVDIITNVISGNQLFALTFSMQIFKFQRCSCKLSFLFPPPPERSESLLAGYMFSSQAFDSLQKQMFLLTHRHWGTFRKEERLWLSDRNSILMM